jgi:phage shock protein E
MDTNFMGKKFKMLAAALGAAVLMMAVFGGCAAGTDTGGSAKDIQANVLQEIPVREAKSLLASPSARTVIDVRTPEEYTTGHLANALNIDYKAASFREEIGKLDKSKPYLVYCRSGKRAAEAVKIMDGLGFTDVKNLAGGILAWQSEGGAVVR